MRLTSTGLGIGTSSPDIFTRGYTRSLGVTSSGSTSIAVNGTSGGYLDVGFNGTRYGQIASLSANDFSISGIGASTSISFLTNFNERARIDSSGNLLVGQTSADGKFVVRNTSLTNTARFVDANASTTSDGVCLVVTDRNTTNNTYYAFGYYNAGAGAYRFRVADSGNVTNTNNSYGAISDVKLKENVTDATPKLDKLNQVRVVNYNLIGETQKQIGVIAQELEQVFPGMVDESPDLNAEGNDLGTTTKSVKYSVFVPMLIKALQEATTEINSLKARLDAANL
jgi:hypothetical protein